MEHNAYYSQKKVNKNERKITEIKAEPNIYHQPQSLYAYI